MKALFLILLFSPLTCSADTLIGKTTLKYIDTPDYQPGGCDEEPGEVGTECIDIGYWRRYELIDFTGIRGEHLEQQSAVLATHTERGGAWLVVLEELSSEEARNFGSNYKIVDGGPTFEGACLNRSIQEYVPSLRGEARATGEEGSCYSVDELQLSNEER